MIYQKYDYNGSFSWQVIGEEGNIIKESKNKNNLILNQGRDYLANNYFNKCFAYCCIGVGTTSPLLTDRGLSNEIKRTNTYYTKENGCLTYLTPSFISSVAPTLNIQRTFDFSLETQTVIYGEIGWSPDGIPGNNLFSKSLTTNQDGNIGVIQVGNRQFLRVKYTLSIVFSDFVGSNSYYSPLSYSQFNFKNWNTITGPGDPRSTYYWGAAIPCTRSLQLLGIMGVDLDGKSVAYDAAIDAGEPCSSNFDIFIAYRPSGVLDSQQFGVSNDFSVNSATQYQQTVTGYVYSGSGSYYRDFKVSFGRNSGSGYINVIGMGLSGSSMSNCVTAYSLTGFPPLNSFNYLNYKDRAYSLDLYYKKIF